MDLQNQFAVGASYLSLCIELTGVMLSISVPVFDAQRHVACRPARGLFIVKPSPGEKHL
jgi:hypothetical protein